jgi:beta-N-acetylhexosaminidase
MINKHSFKINAVLLLIIFSTINACTWFKKPLPNNVITLGAPEKPKDKRKKNNDAIKLANTTIPIFNTDWKTSINKKTWTDSVFNTLTLDQKIGQLFMVAAYSNRDAEHKAEIENLIKENYIGGLIWMQGGPLRQAQLCNHYQSVAKVPLLNSIDGEWGLAMRLDSTTKFPKQMTLGALQNDSLIYSMGVEIARQCKRIGLQLNFAPVVDVNNNPKNPVISNRSFGEDKYAVARKGIAYMKGMQDHGVMANAKHFPGHGDTDADSHLTLPIINASKERIDSLELFPFKALIKEGLSSTMVAHLYIPAIDSTKNRASTLSNKVVTDMLKKDLGFKGLVFTDALNMKGVSSFYAPGEVDLKALIAGNDVLLFAENVPKAVAKIKEALLDSSLTLDVINERCYKILKAKEWSGLNHYAPTNITALAADLNSNRASTIVRDIIRASITVLKNDNDLIPITHLDTLRIATVAINSKKINTFQNRLSDYAVVDNYVMDDRASQTAQDTLLQRLRNYNLVIVGTFDMNNKPDNNFGVTKRVNEFLDSVSLQHPSILCVYGNGYSLGRIKAISQFKTVVMSYQDTDPTQDLTAQLLMGAFGSKGRLPISVCNEYKLGAGINTLGGIRMAYCTPLEVGANEKTLAQIDTIALQAIANKATPGCQIMALKNGKVFYQKSFGTTTYDSKQRVTNNDVYDIASVTKITASLPLVIKMVSNNQFTLDSKLGEISYMPPSNKNNLTLRELLAHQAGLPAWIPFYKATLNSNDAYSSTATTIHTLPVANKLFIKSNYIDTIYNTIYNCKLNDTRKYLYSDLGYYLIKNCIETKTNKTYETLTSEWFYKPLGCNCIGYKPLLRMNELSVVPTEDDTEFRKQLLQGYVHDQGAAMLGGVAGHAGLFSNTNDLAKVMQLYLNKGEYGGQRYFTEETFSEFNKQQFPLNDNRRGAGFDKPEPNAKKDGPCTKLASPESFGHSGFTGTFVWADPKNGLVYIFLSNRVHPNAENKKLTSLNVRTNIHEVLYKSFLK